jgi:two-component system sensor histidine kinase BarA
MTPRARPARLLLVDDNRDNLDVLAFLLSEKYEVAACSSAAEAVRIVESTAMDVLVLDIGMAPMDGLECLKVIRAMPHHAATPAIALTAFARQTDRDDFLEAGFQAVVTKPIMDQQRLEALIDSLLGDIGRRCPLTAGVEDGMITARGRGEAT